jgi:manganese transport protein|tara:strand:- start:61 stop:1488 length:1428 start_codon:yes stop_codon:yes gene_type:complete
MSLNLSFANSWKSHLSQIGPSWIVGAIAAGPATMAAVITAGATFGHVFLWIVILSAVLGSLAQYLSMRLGLLTEAGIIQTVEKNLGGNWAWLLVIDVVICAGIAQLIIMKGVADISEIITGVDSRLWGIMWAIILAVGLAGKGYRFIELVAKILVCTIVLIFIFSLFIVPINLSDAVSGIIPSFPTGVGGALVAAGILGGAVHVSLITVHSYVMMARNWTKNDYSLASFDIGASMLVAFGIYSVAIFLVAASVLHSPTIDPSDLTAVKAAQILGPIAGSNATWLFLLGLWGAGISTLGGNTLVPLYPLADKLGWSFDGSPDSSLPSMFNKLIGRPLDQPIAISRHRLLLVFFALFSASGAFISGSFFSLLVVVLALGLVGTPFALLIVLYLLNSSAVSDRTHPIINLGGITLIIITSSVAAAYILNNHLESAISNPISLSGMAVIFSTILFFSMLLLILKFILTESPLAPTSINE